MKLYEIVFSGQLIPGAHIDRVRANLAKLFHADAQRIELLFSGRRLVLKNTLDQASAEKYRSTLERAGAQVEIVAMQRQPAIAASAQQVQIEEVELAPPPDEPSWTRRSLLSSKASNGGEARPRLEPRDVCMAAFVDVQAPDFTLSAPGSLVQDAKAVPVAPRLDLSGLSLAPEGSDMGEINSVEHVYLPDISHLKLA